MTRWSRLPDFVEKRRGECSIISHHNGWGAAACHRRDHGGFAGGGQCLAHPLVGIEGLVGDELLPRQTLFTIPNRNPDSHYVQP
jgi:hypothetical protein